MAKNSYLKKTSKAVPDMAAPRAAPKKAPKAQPLLPPLQQARKELGQRLGRLLQTFLDDIRFHEVFAKQIPDHIKACVPAAYPHPAARSYCPARARLAVCRARRAYYAPGSGMIKPEDGMWLIKLQKNARTDCLYDTVEAFMAHASLLVANAQRCARLRRRGACCKRHLSSRRIRPVVTSTAARCCTQVPLREGPGRRGQAVCGSEYRGVGRDPAGAWRRARPSRQCDWRQTALLLSPLVRPPCQGEIEVEVAKYRHELDPLVAAVAALETPRPRPTLPDYADGVYSDSAIARRKKLCAEENVRAPTQPLLPPPPPPPPPMPAEGGADSLCRLCVPRRRGRRTGASAEPGPGAAPGPGACTGGGQRRRRGRRSGG